ncbi:hypothetical protein BGZ83_004526, partial [Gryganskiella cystojenkinii]
TDDGNTAPKRRPGKADEGQVKKNDTEGGENDEDDGPNNYRLCAVLYHEGENLESGNYSAAVRIGERGNTQHAGKWFRFNGAALADGPLGWEIVNERACFLLYERTKRKDTRWWPKEDLLRPILDLNFLNFEDSDNDINQLHWRSNKTNSRGIQELAKDSFMVAVFNCLVNSPQLKHLFMHADLLPETQYELNVLRTFWLLVRKAWCTLNTFHIPRAIKIAIGHADGGVRDAQQFQDEFSKMIFRQLR